jgi:hypothetical protein
MTWPQTLTIVASASALAAQSRRQWHQWHPTRVTILDRNKVPETKAKQETGR